MREHTEQDKAYRIFTLPNIISMVRLALVPVIIYAYIGRQDYLLTLILLLISGGSDIVDGWIARHFDMITDIGKFIDPVADKVTQFAVLLCLLTRFPHLIFPVILIVVKELSMLALGMLVYKKQNLVKGAVWHGKLNTVLLYLMFFVHIIWPEVPQTVSDIMIGVCMAMMLYSFVMYMIRFVKMLRYGDPDAAQEDADAPPEESGIS